MRLNDRLYNRIKGGLYHSTSIPNYRKIRGSKAVLPNKGLFPLSHGQSVNSCCYKLGAISLLDLRSPTLPLVGKGAWNNWLTFLTHHKPITVLLDIDPSCLAEPLRDHESVKALYPYNTFVVEAEACYPGPIAIEGIRRCILICSALRNFRVKSGWEITDQDFSRAEKSFKAKIEKARRGSGGGVRVGLLSMEGDMEPIEG